MPHPSPDSSNPAQPAALAESAWIQRLAAPLLQPGLNANSSAALRGLTFAVKDNIDVAALPTTAACPAFAYTAQKHAPVVQHLLEAGAALLGKTNLDQFACGLNGSRSPYGAVPNAFNPRYISGGSSSGSAYVVATGQVDFALGTDTAGSGRVPASFNNIVGLKPSRGLLSLQGVVPAAASLDCVSIFARDVALAARVLQVAVAAQSRAGKAALDASLAPSPTLLSTAWPKTVRLGLARQLDFGGDALAEQAYQQALRLAEAMGARLLEVDYRPLAEVAQMLYESALVAERYAGIRDFFDAHEQSVIEPVRSIIAGGRRYSAADLFAAQARLQMLRLQVQPLWQSIDALFLPTTPTIYTLQEMQADPVNLNRQLGRYTNFVNLLDYAALAVPACMRTDGLPFGMSFIAPAGSDWRLAELGQRFHQASGMSQGALTTPLPAAAASAVLQPARSADTVRIAVVGAHLSGMPLNGQLLEHGAQLECVSRTAALYRLYALAGTTPPKPGLLRVAPELGTSVAVEVWRLPLAQYGSFVAAIPAPLGIARLQLADGDEVQGFLCEPYAVAGALDISAYGGWRAYCDAMRLAEAQAVPAGSAA